MFPSVTATSRPTMMTMQTISIGRQQRGAVLFVALVFLLLITLLTLTAMGTSILQEKMTGGMRNQQLAMMGAESAVRGTEAWLWHVRFNDPLGNPLPPCVGGTDTCVYRPSQTGTLLAGVQQFRSSFSWVSALPGMPSYAHVLSGLGGDEETASLARQPEVMLEDIGPNVPPKFGQQSGAIDPESQNAYHFYRITARSQGGNASVQRVVESVYSASNMTDAGAATP